MPKLKWGQTLSRDEINRLLETHDKELEGKFSRLRSDHKDEAEEKELDEKRQKERAIFWSENKQYWQGTDEGSKSRRKEWDNYRGDRTKRHNKENSKIDSSYLERQRKHVEKYAAANTRHEEKWYGKEGEPNQPGVWQAVKPRISKEDAASTQANTNYVTKRKARHTREDLQREYNKAQYWFDQVKLQLKQDSVPQQDENLNPLVETVEQIPQASKAKTKTALEQQFNAIVAQYKAFEEANAGQVLSVEPLRKNRLNKPFKLVSTPDSVIKKSFHDSLKATEEEEILSALIETIDAIQVNDPIVEVEPALPAPKSAARIERDTEFNTIATRYATFEQPTVDQALDSELPPDQLLTKIRQQGRLARAAYHSLRDISLANDHEKIWNDRSATHAKENKVTQEKHVKFDFAARQSTYQENEKEILEESDDYFRERNERHQDKDEVINDARKASWKARDKYQKDENSTRNAERNAYSPNRKARHDAEDKAIQDIKDHYVENRETRHKAEDKPLDDNRKQFWADRKTRQEKENSGHEWQDWKAAQIPLQEKTNSARTGFRAKNESERLANELLEDAKLKKYYGDIRADITEKRRNTDINYGKREQTWKDAENAGVSL